MGKDLLKILYKVLTVLIVTVWGAIIVFYGALCVMKTFYPLKYRTEIMENAGVYSIEPALIFAVVKVESGFDPLAVSGKGAVGLMQITESTGKYIAKLCGVKNYQLLDVDTNIKFGCFYLNYLLVKFKDVDTAICAYNAGEGKVSAWLNDNRYSDDQITLKTVPFKETREYLNKIKKTFEKYKKLYGNILDKREKIE